ncbi:MAG TPA: PIG-L family deacetylase, partial [Thermoanaerobaculia bacterium]|nr:PIG-L family deacetylase [Thermoanaerobaculia bacterium]
PPDRAETVAAASVLVVAPHPDDEVLGCGGLLVGLVERGAAVRVVFLTDGGGDAEGEARAAYVARRREEAAAVAGLLGFAGVEHVGLPDGALDRHLDEAAAALRRALLAQRPELLLVPSPLEASRDHRAAFAALHRLLAPLRPGDPARAGEPLAQAAAGLRVLVYEVNRPAYPDLLVDVSAAVPRLAEAMELYASQRERLGYWRAALGLKRYRTLTLGSDLDGPDAAEGFRRLAAADFATRSPAQLVAALGGVPELHAVREGPRISVIVRTRDRPALLAEALASLAAGTYRNAEVVLVNDGGAPPAVPDEYPLPVVRVDLPENRGRAAAAEAGVRAAGGDWIAFLDDDDLAAPEHLATLAELAGAAGVRVAYTDAAVAVYELAGPGEDAPEAPGGWVCRERRLPYSRDFDPDLLLLDNYVPFNTILVERALLAEAGPFDESFDFFEDWDLLIRLAALAPFHHLPRVTCEYRHFRGAGHHVLGAAPRQRADFLAMKARVLAKHVARIAPEVLARAVDTLRTEAVDAAEAAAAARREAEDARRRHEGELVALREERLRLLDDERRQTAALADHDRQFERMFAEEAELRRVVADQEDHLRRTYAEIERLGGVIRDMEATRAWRLHQRLSRRPGR